MLNGLVTDKYNQKFWYLNGRLHHEDGPALEYSDGHKEWYIHGELHRLDGPAIEWSDGTTWWYRADKLHRTDGPAVQYANGFSAWYINGKELTESEFNSPSFREFLKYI